MDSPQARHPLAPRSTQQQTEAAATSSQCRNSTSTSAAPFAKERWTLSDFDVGRKLGEGRFGKIYLARERLSKCAVVLKLIAKEAVVRFDMKHQIQREIELHMHCRHRNILRMLAYFWDDERIFLVLEYADGGDLLAALRSYPSGRMPERVAARYVADVSNALAYLHSQSVLHRDVKPENILLKKGHVKLADFTWAVLCHEGGARRRTLCGTLDYLSPELLQREAYDAAVDAWSLGVVAYELLCGRPPFERHLATETCQRIRQCEFTMPAFVSSDAADFITRLLCADSAARMTTEQCLAHPWLAPFASERSSSSSCNHAVAANSRAQDNNNQNANGSRSSHVNATTGAVSPSTLASMSIAAGSVAIVAVDDAPAGVQRALDLDEAAAPRESSDDDNDNARRNAQQHQQLRHSPNTSSLTISSMHTTMNGAPPPHAAVAVIPSTFEDRSLSDSLSAAPLIDVTAISMCGQNNFSNVGDALALDTL